MHIFNHQAKYAHLHVHVGSYGLAIPWFLCCTPSLAVCQTQHVNSMSPECFHQVKAAGAVKVAWQVGGLPSDSGDGCGWMYKSSVTRVGIMGRKEFWLFVFGGWLSLRGLALPTPRFKIAYCQPTALQKVQAEQLFSLNCPHLAGNSGELLQSPGVASAESVEVFTTKAITSLKFEGAA